jgi:hypothetical protein
VSISFRGFLHVYGGSDARKIVLIALLGEGPVAWTSAGVVKGTSSIDPQKQKTARRHVILHDGSIVTDLSPCPPDRSGVATAACTQKPSIHTPTQTSATFQASTHRSTTLSGPQGVHDKSIHDPTLAHKLSQIIGHIRAIRAIRAKTALKTAQPHFSQTFRSRFAPSLPCIQLGLSRR